MEEDDGGNATKGPDRKSQAKTGASRLSVCVPKRDRLDPSVPWPVRCEVYRRLARASSGASSDAWADDVEASLFSSFGRAVQPREYCRSADDLVSALRGSTTLTTREAILSTDVSALPFLTPEFLREGTTVGKHLAERRRTRDEQKRSFREWADQIESTSALSELERGKQVACVFCKSKRVMPFERQNRAADEPATVGYECLDCMREWVP